MINSAFKPLQKAAIFTKLDLRNTYHLVRLQEGNEWKTFDTLYHLASCDALQPDHCPAVFQSLINDILRDFINHYVFVYLDDILIFSQNLQEHISHIRQVLQWLLENKVFVKDEKCLFHVSYIIVKGQVSGDSDKIQAVAEWLKPISLKQLQWFLGFANLYSHFIKEYSQVAAPLTKHN